MRLIIMFIAIALAAGAFFITMHLTSSDAERGVPVAEPKVVVKDIPTTDIYTAKVDIPIGSVIKQDMLDIQPWPKHLLLPDMVPANPSQVSDVVKMVARTPFQKGEPIIMNKLANEKDPSFLAASIPKGMRVVTIGTDAIAGVAGFIFPGDRVDVLITHDVVVGREDNMQITNAQNSSGMSGGPPAGGGMSGLGSAVSGNLGGSANATADASGPTSILRSAKKEPVTEVLLSSVRVMAVNQKSTAHGGDLPTVPSNITLEVSAEDAQKLRLTENSNGRLSLVLRSLKDQEEITAVHPTTVNDLSSLTPPGATNEGGPKVIVARGAKVESVEVSRP